MSIVTVELQGHDGTGVRTFYLSDLAYNTLPTDTPANTVFAPVLKEAADFEQQIGVDGTATIGFGQSILINDGRFDEWDQMSFCGRPFVVKVLDGPDAVYSETPPALVGVVEDVDIADAFTTIRIRLYDKLLDLDKPLLTERYGGTTEATGPTADGDENLKGSIKKRIYGEQPNFEADLANSFDRIWQLSDKSGVSAKAYDGGMELTPTTDYPSLATLHAASMAPGTYATCLNASDSVPPGGMFVRLASRPRLQLTFDAVAGATEADRSASVIARQMLIDFGIAPADIDDDSFDALHDANDAVCGIRISDESTAKSAIERILRSIGAALVPGPDGKWIVARIDAPLPEPAEPVAEFEEWQLLGDVRRLDPQDGKNGMPIWRVVVRYRQLGRAHTEAELDTAITQERRDYLIGPNVYREEIAEDPSVKAVHMRAEELIIETQLIRKADAKAEGERILALRKVKRPRWQFTVSERYGRAVQLASTIKLTMSRFMPNGRRLVALRRLRQYALNKITFDVWG